MRILFYINSDLDLKNSTSWRHYSPTQRPLILFSLPSLWRTSSAMIRSSFFTRATLRSPAQTPCCWSINKSSGLAKNRFRNSRLLESPGIRSRTSLRNLYTKTSLIVKASILETFKQSRTQWQLSLERLTRSISCWSQFRTIRLDSSPRRVRIDSEYQFGTETFFRSRS